MNSLRRKVCLNGEWNFSPEAEARGAGAAVQDCHWEALKLRVPSSWRWSEPLLDHGQPYQMFDYPEKWNAALSGVVGRTFTVQRQGSERVFLILNGVLQSSAVFVNGIKVAGSQEAWLPMEIDITDQVRDNAENDLKVWCGSFAGAQTESGYRLLTPGGSWFSRLARGLWQDVFVEYRPATRIEDVYVQTSTRQQTLLATVQIVNQAAAQQGRVDLKIYDGQTLVKELSSERLDLGPGQTTAVGLETAWPEAVFWSPENPHLYSLQAELICDGAVTDLKASRFGFREVWLDQHRFYLNGQRLNLRGDAWHYQGFVQQTKDYALNWYKLCRDTGINFVRLHAMPYPEFYLDAADEVGMLIVDESAIYGSGKAMQADRPEFIENCRRHLQALVHRDRQHPSVIIWSMQNEMRWVDGRDGYKAAMKDLTRAMKELDGTRPVSYDGDNRLVDPTDMEIVSMHYNIDGTVAGWDKTKPLAFGEHGKWHYVAPQGCSALGGPEAYLSVERCLESMGLDEQLFNEYARKEEVTALCPFNTANYVMTPMGTEEILLDWADLTTPGPKPRRIRPYTLNLNNGLAPHLPLYQPNPGWKYIRDSFKPIAVFADEYNTAFYGGTLLERNFSIYNDAESPAEARLVFELSVGGQRVDCGEIAFRQAPGERYGWQHTFHLPDVAELQPSRLELKLYHHEALMHTLVKDYRLYPAAMRTAPVELNGKRVAFIGGDASYSVLAGLVKPLPRLSDLGEDQLRDVDVLVIGKDFPGKPAAVQPQLEKYVSGGGFLIVLEQNGFAPGEVTLSGRGFYSAYRADPDHPIFDQVNDDDLRFWGPGNFHRTDGAALTQNAFDKPELGNLRILLECGEGDFGWGGLLWTPLVEYALGTGRVVLSQLNLMTRFDTAPAAAQLLRNLLAYAVSAPRPAQNRTGLMARPASTCAGFFDAIGLEHTLVAATDDLSPYTVIVLDPELLDQAMAGRLAPYLQAGGQVVILPVEPEHQPGLALLTQTEVQVLPADTYQVRPLPHPLTRGISPHDLFHIERVTYTPFRAENSIICDHAVRLPGAEGLWESVKTPWRDLFVNGLDGEPVKMAVVAETKEAAFTPQTYGVVKATGRGRVVISQVKLLPGNAKIKRVYSRLLGNLGASLHAPLLSHVKDEQDYAIPSFMVLMKEANQDYAAMEAYFSDRNYILNNLGEGVYGWMKRAEKKDGRITLAESAGRTCFLTVFVFSEMNRDPGKRAAGTLPDNSIVPDLLVSANCALKLFVNGRPYYSRAEASGETVEVKIDDVLLDEGLNRLAVVCQAGAVDAQFNLCFKNKFGEYLPGLKYQLTMD